MEENPCEFNEISGMAILVPIYVENTVTSFYGKYGEWDILLT
jgi:hypothetical protein